MVRLTGYKETPKRKLLDILTGPSLTVLRLPRKVWCGLGKNKITDTLFMTP